MKTLFWKVLVCNVFAVFSLQLASNALALPIADVEISSDLRSGNAGNLPLAVSPGSSNFSGDYSRSASELLAPNFPVDRPVKPGSDQFGDCDSEECAKMDFSASSTQVLEPGTIALLVVGLFGLLVSRYTIRK